LLSLAVSLEHRTQKWKPLLGSSRCPLILDERIVGSGKPGPLFADADLRFRTMREGCYGILNRFPCPGFSDEQAVGGRIPVPVD
jgi:hypothetical protein